jgi:hypothetical protein
MYVPNRTIRPYTLFPPNRPPTGYRQDSAFASKPKVALRYCGSGSTGTIRRGHVSYEAIAESLCRLADSRSEAMHEIASLYFAAPARRGQLTR